MFIKKFLNLLNIKNLISFVVLFFVVFVGIFGVDKKITDINYALASSGGGGDDGGGPCGNASGDGGGGDNDGRDPDEPDPDGGGGGSVSVHAEFEPRCLGGDSRVRLSWAPVATGFQSITTCSVQVRLLRGGTEVYRNPSPINCAPASFSGQTGRWDLVSGAVIVPDLVSGSSYTYEITARVSGRLLAVSETDEDLRLSIIESFFSKVIKDVFAQGTGDRGGQDRDFSDNNSNSSRTATATFTARNCAPSVTLTASPRTIPDGGSSTLAWSSNNVTSCVGVGPGFSTGNRVSGNDPVSPTITTTYRINCNGPAGEATDSVQVVVRADLIPTTITLPASVSVGNPAIFTARSRNVGGTGAPSHKTRFCIDNPNCLTTSAGQLAVRQVSGLAPGVFSPVLSGTWNSPTPGVHRVYFCTDIDDEVAEGGPNEGVASNCTSAEFNTSSLPPPSPRQCSDGMDNDNDGRTDFGQDPGCESADDDDETDNCSPNTGDQCESAPNNNCVPPQTNQGFVQCDGSCSAQVPPNSQCEAPIISCSGGPCIDIINKGSQCVIEFTVENADSCVITGPGGFREDLNVPPNTHRVVTPALNISSVYTITCFNGAGEVFVAQTFSCRINPQEQEI